MSWCRRRRALHILYACLCKTPYSSSFSSMTSIAALPLLAVATSATLETLPSPNSLFFFPAAGLKPSCSQATNPASQSRGANHPRVLRMNMWVSCVPCASSLQGFSMRSNSRAFHPGFSIGNARPKIDIANKELIDSSQGFRDEGRLPYSRIKSFGCGLKLGGCFEAIFVAGLDVPMERDAVAPVLLDKRTKRR